MATTPTPASRCEGCCCCHRPSVDDATATPSPVDKRTWQDVNKFYEDGFIEAISPQLPHLPEWASKRYGQATKSTCLPEFDFDFSYRIHFADMQRLYMRRLQATLIDFAVSQRFDEEESHANSGVFEMTMKEYVQAVRDHEYMARFSGQASDPFVASAERAHDRFLIEKAMLWRGKTASDLLPGAGEPLTDLDRLKASSKRTGPWERVQGGRPVMAIANTRGQTLKKALWSRLVGALLGGMFLIGPMWLLVLVREIWVHLGVTTGCVFAFGLLASWSLSTLGEVFAATLAYAAVLMVFVGVMLQAII